MTTWTSGPLGLHGERVLRCQGWLAQIVHQNVDDSFRHGWRAMPSDWRGTAES